MGALVSFFSLSRIAMAVFHTPASQVNSGECMIFLINELAPSALSINVVPYI